jgi:phenylalanyl-tRNA synthetase beta chain
MVGAKLPGDKAITAAKLRGVDSAGMLCSAKELGLADTSEGIIELPADAPVGSDLRTFLELDDDILELNVTPNRGDAMSVLGIAREVAALTRSEVRCRYRRAPWYSRNAPGEIVGAAGLPEVHLPDHPWHRQRAPIAHVAARTSASRRTAADLPVVDVTQYVMLELGQPMHAYDLASSRAGSKRAARRRRERSPLLDGKEIELTPDVLVIADGSGPVGLAGVMGGCATLVHCTTTRCACSKQPSFSRRRGGGSRPSLRLGDRRRPAFERGVDPLHQEARGEPCDAAVDRVSPAAKMARCMS